MTTETTTPEVKKEEATTPVKSAAPSARPRNPRAGARPGGRPGAGRGKGAPRRQTRRKSMRPKSEFEQKIIGIRRVTRVMAGGRRFSFSVSIVIGDKKGRVGVGVGKASDTALAIEKSIRKARASMITVKRTKTNSIPHEVKAKYCSSEVMMIPVKGKGLVAGSSVRNVLNLAGVTDISAKILTRSKNKLNNAQAAIVALKQL